MNSKFYFFGQNNSGGYYVEDDVVGESVVFEADSSEDANKRASNKGVFGYYSCSCCGERFTEQFEYENEGFKSVEDAFNDNTFYKGKSCVVHYKNGKVERMNFNS